VVLGFTDRFRVIFFYHAGAHFEVRMMDLPIFLSDNRQINLFEASLSILSFENAQPYKQTSSKTISSFHLAGIQPRSIQAVQLQYARAAINASAPRKAFII
jgi:hypothetical protein